MTYKGGEFSFEALYGELKNKVIAEKIESIGQYKEMVENLIEEKKSYGFLDESEDWPQLVRDLLAKWPDLEKEIARRSGRPMT